MKSINRNRTLKGLLLGALALPGAAFTADEAPKPPASTPAAVFAKLDGNQDGRISLMEAGASAELQAAFDKVDANHDGFLTASEFSTWEGAGNISTVAPRDPTTAPTGSSGAQHMPKRD